MIPYSLAKARVIFSCHITKQRAKSSESWEDDTSRNAVFSLGQLIASKTTCGNLINSCHFLKVKHARSAERKKKRISTQCYKKVYCNELVCLWSSIFLFWMEWKQPNGVYCTINNRVWVMTLYSCSGIPTIFCVIMFSTLPYSFPHHLLLGIQGAEG